MHYKSSYIQLLLRIIEVSRTFWSRGHAFRSELASPRYVTIISSPREGGRVALSSATDLKPSLIPLRAQSLFCEAVLIPLRAQTLFCEAVLIPLRAQSLFVKPFLYL